MLNLPDISEQLERLAPRSRLIRVIGSLLDDPSPHRWEEAVSARGLPYALDGIEGRLELIADLISHGVTPLSAEEVRALTGVVHQLEHAPVASRPDALLTAMHTHGLLVGT